MYKENEDGSIILSYEDYNVEAFGGADYEAIYELSKENADKLKEILLNDNEATQGQENLDLKTLIINKFGEELKKHSFALFCDKKKIIYKLNTYIH